MAARRSCDGPRSLPSTRRSRSRTSFAFWWKTSAAPSPRNRVGEVAKRLGDRVRGGHPLALDPLADGLDQRLVLEQSEVELEDLGGLRPQLDRGLVPIGLQVALGLLQGLPQPLELSRHLVGAHGLPGHSLPSIVENKSSTDDHTGRNRDALDDFHAVAGDRPRAPSLNLSASLPARSRRSIPQNRGSRARSFSHARPGPSRRRTAARSAAARSTGSRRRPLMSSTITTMHGRTSRIRTVALMRPKAIEIAIGMRNRAWNDCSSISGVRPSTVVIVVRKMGRRRLHAGLDQGVAQSDPLRAGGRCRTRSG